MSENMNREKWIRIWDNGNLRFEFLINDLMSISIDTQKKDSGEIISVKRLL